MRRLPSFAIGVLALVLAPAIAQATCTDTAAVAATRAEGDMQCPCATAANHGQYVHCVAGVAKAAVASGSLPQECKSAVVRCAANSTCGKPGSQPDGMHPKPAWKTQGSVDVVVMGHPPVHASQQLGQVPMWPPFAASQSLLVR